MHSVTMTIFPVFAFKVTLRVILLTRFCNINQSCHTVWGARASSASMARRLCILTMRTYMYFVGKDLLLVLISRARCA